MSHVAIVNAESLQRVELWTVTKCNKEQMKIYVIRIYYVYLLFVRTSQRGEEFDTIFT